MIPFRFKNLSLIVTYSKVLTTILSFLLLLTIEKKNDENASQNLKVFASTVGPGAFGTLFYFWNRLKLVNLIPAYRDIELINKNLNVSVLDIFHQYSYF